VHRSRLTAAYFDVTDKDFEVETAFWSGALGRRVEGADDPDYIELAPRVGGLQVLVQRVGDGTPARVHFDIETDDMEAEVARLVKLGATKVEVISTWVVMRDPAGLLFCVVGMQSPAEFEANATTWED
jgi:predicted enzyme related to lactoylglutathione lyase